MACTLGPPGLMELGGRPHASKVASPVIRRGATVPTDCRVVLQLKAECFRTRERHYNGRLQTCATPSTHSPLEGRNIALPVSVPDRGGRSLQTPSWIWMFVKGVCMLDFARRKNLSLSCVYKNQTGDEPQKQDTQANMRTPKSVGSYT